MKVAVVVGTRPEAIKLAPVIFALRDEPGLEPFVISTGQHREMLDQVLDWFGIRPDVDLGLMRPRQSLNSLVSLAIAQLDEAFRSARPSAVLVQGDTSTAFSGALAAFHLGIPVGHVEAGLRTYNLDAPFPEEANRSLISRVSAWHFAPTDRAADVLRQERVPGIVEKTGNTVVDALLYTATRASPPALELGGARLVLITGHRRENVGARFQQAFGAIASLAEQHPDVDFVYPVHLNPAVREHAHEILRCRSNIRLIEPVSYPEFIALMKRAYLVLTDSGGVQEEAPSFGVPVLVMRETTERPEAIEAGVAHIVGTGRDSIIAAVTDLLRHPTKRAAYAKIENPFGDGTAAVRIARHLRGALIGDRED